MSKHTVAQVEDMIATENDEVVRAMLREYADLLEEKAENGTTHYAGCIQAGPKHYECALQEVGRLRLTITHLRAELEKKTWLSAYEKKEWVGLTVDEIDGIYNQDKLIYKPLEFYRAIEAKLKDKNI
jgi:hypothetical protein